MNNLQNESNKNHIPVSVFNSFIERYKLPNYKKILKRI